MKKQNKKYYLIIGLCLIGAASFAGVGVNPDIYAWIKIPETNVDYPIVQSSDDNGYYLNHDIYGEKKAEGTIFTENYNTKTFEDPNTVIYGHDRKKCNCLWS